MEATEKKDVKKKALHRPKRTNLHLSLVLVSTIVAVAVTYITASHLAPVITALPVFMQELLDKIVFHEDLIEEVIAERI